MPKSIEVVETVAPRNDPNPLAPYAKSQALQLSGMDPAFAYEWFRQDQLKVKLSRHEIGSEATGYLMVEPWEVVSVGDVGQGRAREDAGKPLDTKVTNGELILCRTPKDNHAKYGVIEAANDSLIDKRLSQGERHRMGSSSHPINFKTRTAGGRAGLGADPNDIIGGIQ